MGVPTAGAAAPSRSSESGRRDPQLILLRALWQIDRGRTTLLLSFIVVSGLAPIVTIGLTGSLLGAVRDKSDNAEILAALLGGVFLIQALLRSGQALVAGEVSERLEVGLRTRVMRAVAAPSSLAHYEDPAILELVTSATTVGTARYGPGSAVAYGLPAAIQQVTGIGMACVLALVAWWLPLVLVAIWIPLRRRIAREAIEQMAVIGFQTGADRRGGYFRDLALLPGGAKEIRVFGLAPWLVDRYHSHWLASMKDIWSARSEHQVRLLTLFGVAVGSHVLAFTLLVDAFRDGRLDLRGFVVCAQAALGVTMLGGAGRDDVVVEWGAATIPAVERLERALPPAPPERSDSRPLLQQDLRFADVSFGYAGQLRAVLEGFSLVVPRGQSLAIVGHNGSGKTTLVKLIAGLLDPSSGAVLVDGTPISVVGVRSWRRHLGVVFQDFARYPFSLEDNIRVGASGRPVTDEQLERVIERAGLREVVARLPGGTSTTLSPRYPGGVDLSGGEWQRVALARALLAVETGAEVLVLDEPTANLDVRSEAAFYDRFLELTRGVTTIVISHRFSTLRRADRIVVLEDGRVTEDGNHADLATTGGLYARMFSAQAEAFAQDA